ncbi:MAG: cell division protein SepF [Mycobacteriales bacterium]
MAGAIRKMGIYLGLVEDDEDRRRAEEYDDYDSYEEPEPVRTVSPAASRSSRPVADPYAQGSLAVEPVARLARDDEDSDAPAGDSVSYQITTLHPRNYNEARIIGEHVRSGIPVIMNLSEMDDSDARRLVDFAAGLTFGLRGTIDRVTNRVFLLSPANVQVTPEDKARIAEGGFFNQS